MKKIQILMLLLFISPLHFAMGQQYGWVALNPASIPDSADLSDLYFIDDTTGWLSSSSHNHIFKTTDGGLTFTTQNTTLTTNAIHMVSNTGGYCGGYSGFVYRTTDGGATWPFIGTITNTLIDISFPPSGGTGYACGFNGAIYSITSIGVAAMTSGIIDNLDCLAFPVDSTEGWVCGGSIINHYTGGAWVGDQFRPAGGYNSIYLTDNQNGWAVGDDGIIIHTTDGQNWVAQTNPDPQNRSLFDVFFMNSNEGWAVGSNGIILHTTNGGTNWNVEATGLTTDFLTGVHFTSPTNGYITGQYKTLLKYTQLSGIENKEPLLGINIYPNPTTSTLNIECPQSQNLNVNLFNLMGEPVMQKNYTGTKEEIDISSLPAGMYFARITVDKQMIVKKIIKQ